MMKAMANLIHRSDLTGRGLDSETEGKSMRSGHTFCSAAECLHRRLDTVKSDMRRYSETKASSREWFAREEGAGARGEIYSNQAARQAR
jgi:hypothetical protein